MNIWLTYFLTGIISSFLAGLLGIGGGLVIVPSLLFIFSYFNVINHAELMHVAMGTSLAASILNLVASFIIHSRRNNIEWPVFQAMLPGVMLGSLIIGPYVMTLLSTNTLQIVFGVACLLFGLHMLLPSKKIEQEENLPGKKTFAGLGVLTGTLSVLLGLAGGVIIGSILNFYHMNMRRVIGTTASIAMILAISGSVSLMILGYQNTIPLPPWSTGFIYWPALFGVALPSLFITPLGAKAANQLPVPLLKRAFALLVLAVGSKMLL